MSKVNENRLGYKKTKIGWIPRDWEIVTAKAVCKTISKGTTPKQYIDEANNMIPYLRVNNLTFCGPLNLSNLKFIDYITHSEYLKRSIIYPNDIVINIVGPPLGKVNMVDNRYTEYNINQAIAFFRPQNIFPSFLYYWLSSEKCIYNLKTQAKKTSGQANLTLQICNDTIIAIPPLPEQKKIAEILSLWDKAIEKLEKLIKLKEKRKKGLMQELIEKQCKNWKHLRSDKIFKTISDKNHPNDKLLSVTQNKGVIPRSMLEGKVMSPEGSVSGYKRIKKGDYAISLRSFQGGIEYSNYTGIISPAYTVLRPSIVLNTDFYRYFFKSHIFINKYLSKAVIGIRDGKQISFEDFSSVHLPIPDINEQKKIADIQMMADQEVSCLQSIANKYREQKKGLMQKLLTGEIRVKI